MVPPKSEELMGNMHEAGRSPFRKVVRPTRAKRGVAEAGRTVFLVGKDLDISSVEQSEFAWMAAHAAGIPATSPQHGYYLRSSIRPSPDGLAAHGFRMD